MKHIAIITSYTNHIRWDNYGKCDYGDFASLNHHEYSNKHGYSYIKKIVKNHYDFDCWELPDNYYKEVKKLKKRNKKLLNKLFKIYKNEK